MKKLLILAILCYAFAGSLKSQENTVKDDPAVLKSIQGTYAITEEGKQWNKILIKGDTLKLYEAWPAWGKFNLVGSFKIIKSGTVSYRDPNNGKLIVEQFIEMEKNNYFMWNRVFPKTDQAGKKYIILERNPNTRFLKVASTFNPWS